MYVVVRAVSVIFYGESMDATDGLSFLERSLRDKRHLKSKYDLALLLL